MIAAWEYIHNESPMNTRRSWISIRIFCRPGEVTTVNLFVKYKTIDTSFFKIKYTLSYYNNYAYKYY